MILALRTDKPEAELYLLDGGHTTAEITWPAHRQLSETIHQQIDRLLDRAGRQLSDLDGIVIYAGPGSFTGLRIGFSVANALATARDIPIAAVGGQDWLIKGEQAVAANPNSRQVVPDYGALPHITTQKK